MVAHGQTDFAAAGSVAAVEGQLLPGVGGRVKVVVVGDHKVGKTTLVQQIFGPDPVRRVASQSPAPSSTLIAPVGAFAAGLEGQEGPAPTVGIDFARRSVSLGAWGAKHNAGGCVRLQVFDTSGQQRFQSLAESYLQELDDHDAVVLVYDVTRRDTWEKVVSYAMRARSLSKGTPQLALVAAKADVDESLHEVTVAEGHQLAEDLNVVLFVEVGRTAAKASTEVSRDVLRGPCAVEERFLRPLLRTCCEAAAPSIAAQGTDAAAPPKAVGHARGTVAASSCSREAVPRTRCTPWFRCLGLA